MSGMQVKGEYILQTVTWREDREAQARGMKELIRCKDCKYYLQSNEECELISTRLHFYEENKKWENDSFCSWAERKEE